MKMKAALVIVLVAISISLVMSDCPANETICAGFYRGCCPLPDAVCCGNGMFSLAEL